MSNENDSEPKADALRRRGVLNRNPERVTDALFQEDEFFDARDLVQVKYEMLRHVRTEGETVTEAAKAFGTSRFSFYKAQEAFQEEGLPGLVSKKPGPRTRHKITGEVQAFLEDRLRKDPSLHSRELVELVRERFGITVHRRTIERALGGAKKKRRR
jgi:transposase